MDSAAVGDKIIRRNESAWQALDHRRRACDFLHHAVGREGRRVLVPAPLGPRMASTEGDAESALDALASVVPDTCSTMRFQSPAHSHSTWTNLEEIVYGLPCIVTCNK